MWTILIDMLRLGDDVNAGKVTCDSMHIKNAKTLGNDHKNTVELEKAGNSVVYFKFNEYHQLSNFTTTNGSATVQVTVGTNHGVDAGDTVHISGVTLASMNGIPKAALTGSFTVTSKVSNTQFEFSATANAMATGNAGVAALALLLIQRYKSLDLYGDGVTWTHQTTKPTGAHTNAVEHWFSPDEVGL